MLFKIQSKKRERIRVEILLKEVGRIEDLVSFMTPIAEAFMKGCCICYFFGPFMVSLGMPGRKGRFWLVASYWEKKKGAVCGGVVYFFTILLFYTTRVSLNVYVIYGMASLAMFFVICWIDKRNYNQKLFLAITFASLSLFSASMAEILYDFIYDAIAKTNYMHNHPEMYSVLYVTMHVCYLVLDFVFTAAGIRKVLQIYEKRSVEMERRELAMLSLPSFMGMTGYEIMRYYRVFYAIEKGEMEKTYDILTLLFCMISSVTIIAVIMFYQDMIAMKEDQHQEEFLAVQIRNTRQHIEQVESLYQKIRSIKHDMANHILILERLYEGNKTAEAKTYSQELKTELAQMTGEMKSGNPVTDVILQEFQKEAEKKDIFFHTEFYYPQDSNLNVFDLSVILNNALQNAIENTDQGKGQQISIVSYRRNNAYIINIHNHFDGSLKWNIENGLPVTSKEKTNGHGYGLLNIRRVAEKYSGDIDIEIKNGEFYLCVMLMLE